MWAQVINMFLGLAVMVAPAIWQFDQTTANNNYIIGPFVITFAMVAITDVARNVRWFNIPLGAWLIISPLFLDSSSPAPVVNIILGVSIIVLSFIRGKVSNRFGGGWRSLLRSNPQHMQEADRTR